MAATGLGFTSGAVHITEMAYLFGGAPYLAAEAHLALQEVGEALRQARGVAQHEPRHAGLDGRGQSAVPPVGERPHLRHGVGDQVAHVRGAHGQLQRPSA